MKTNFILEDTEQTKEMKEHALFFRYTCSGEVYKLLSMQVCHELAKKIQKGRINLNSKLLYGRDYITLEENFVSLLDKYIGYVRNTYTIRANELVIILEETLKNMYNRTLFYKVDFHKSPEIFLNYFKKMFLANLVYNTRYYAKKDKYKEYLGLQQANLFLDGKQLTDDKDLDKIEKFYINVINNRKDNLYDSFIPHGELNEARKKHCIMQLNWIYESYYKKNTSIFDD